MEKRWTECPYCREVHVSKDRWKLCPFCGNGGTKAGNEAYTVDEVAALSGFSRRTVIRLFEGERGVIVLARPSANHKRRYRSVRIPRAVYERVIGRLTTK